MHGTEPPSDWIRRWSHLLPDGAPVLDVACGAGRHLRWFAGRGHPVTGVDRDAQALTLASQTVLAPAAAIAPGARGTATTIPSATELLQADIESGPWPWPGRRFGAVVVTNYLWRPLLPTLVDSVAPGGVLLYETFAVGQETIGRPARPDFLLRPGELLAACAGLRVVAFEDGFEPAAAARPARFVQRIAAVREEVPAAGGEGHPTRHRLSLEWPDCPARAPQ